MFKKLFALLVALVMMLSMYTFAAAEETTSVPAVDDQIGGFTVKEVSRFDLVGADVVVYEHNKTGALVMMILNEDLNRVFTMAFRTPTLDNKGTAHVFEHATLDGSAKYPSGSLFFNLNYQTYNTYMNASTFNFMTIYPIASLSEAQLLKYADFYTDSCFNPVLMEDESVFNEEAWRYEMTDADAPLTLNGTVYTEMQGSYTLENAAMFNGSIAAFPGANGNYVHGGKPSDIPDLTWEDLKQYHDTYYHPSNSLTLIYGKIEQPEAFLALLDGYFSAYDRKDPAVLNEGYTPITAAVETRFEYPVASGTDTANGAAAFYTYVCPDMTEAEYNALDLFTTLMCESFSPMSTRMHERLPAASAACYVDGSGPEKSVVFYVTGINDGEEAIFRQIVQESIADAVENGFDPEGSEAAIASVAFNLLLAGETSNVGVSLIPSIAYSWACEGDHNGYFESIAQVSNYTEMMESGAMLEAARRNLMDNGLTALAVTVPAAGMKEVEDAALEEKLAAVKAGMTEDEIAAIVVSTNTAKPAEDSADLVRELTAVTVESLPEEIRVYDVQDVTDENGIRRIYVTAGVEGVGTTVIMLDASGLTQDQILYFKLFCDLLSDLPTTSHTREQLGALALRYLHNGVIRVSSIEDEATGELSPYMRITFTARDEDLQAGYEFVHELLFDTQFTDAALIRDCVTALKTSLKQTIHNDAYSMIIQYAMATGSAASRYYTYVTYLDYYNFLCDVEQQLETEPETVLAGLQAVQTYFNNRSGAVVGYIGNADGFAVNDAAAESFLGKLDERAIEAQAYQLPMITDWEAIILNLNVQFNCVYATWDQLGVAYDAGMGPVANYVNDRYLTPILREQNGVYTVLHYATDEGIYLLTYRDPGIADTYAVYENAGALIAADEAPTQETLDGYILSAYAAETQTGGELTDGLSVMLNTVGGKTQDVRLADLRQLKQVTPETVAAAVDLYTAVYTKGVHITAGSAAAINAEAERFALILNPFGAVDAGEVTLSDVTEDDWYYEAVRTCYESMVMTPVADDRFGVEEPATLGDLAAVLYYAVGGGLDADAGIAFLSENGLIPAGNADDTMTREELGVYLYNFCWAVGVEVSPVEPEGYADADQFSSGASGAYGCMLQYEIVRPLEDGTLAPQATATRADLAWALYVLLFAE